MKITQDTGTLQTVARAIALLRCFEGGGEALSLADLTNLMGLNKVTVLRLAQTLVAEGVLNKHPEKGTYRVSYGLLSLARSLLNPDNLITQARPILKAAQMATNETAMLSIQVGYEAVVVCEIPSPQPIKYTLGVGYRSDIRLGAAGLAMMANMQETEFEDVLLQPVPESALGVPLTPDRVRALVEKVKQDGVLTTSGMRFSDATGYAAPFTAMGDVFAGAISIVLPTNRDANKENSARIEAAVRRAASDLNAKFQLSHT